MRTSNLPQRTLVLTVACLMSLACDYPSPLALLPKTVELREVQDHKELWIWPNTPDLLPCPTALQGIRATLGDVTLELIDRGGLVFGMIPNCAHWKFRSQQTVADLTTHFGNPASLHIQVKDPSQVDFDVVALLEPRTLSLPASGHVPRGSTVNATYSPGTDTADFFVTFNGSEVETATVQGGSLAIPLPAIFTGTGVLKVQMSARPAVENCKGARECYAENVAHVEASVQLVIDP